MLSVTRKVNRPMRLLPALSLSLAAVLTLAACSSGAGGATPSAVPASPGGGSLATSADLDGRTFLSTDVEGYTLAPGSQIQLTFEGVRLGVSAGCNQMGGEYSLTDGVLELGPMASTEMACEEPLMSQDAWIAAFLPGALATIAEDSLTLARDGVTLTLLDEEVASPDRPLEGTRWVVDGIVTADAVSSVPVGATAALTFDGGTVSVEAGCNSGSGTYESGDGTVTFGPIGTTKMACADDVMALETAVLLALAGEANYTIDTDTLTLQNGANGLVLKAAA